MCDEMYNRDRCSLLEVRPLTLDPCESETCLCFQKGPPPLLLSVVWWEEGGLQGKLWFQPKAQSALRAWNLICPLLIHPSRLLTFTPDPVTPSCGLQQQQKQEIREINRLEGITVALFISGCAHSWHSLLAVLQLNLSAVYFLVCVLMLASVCT